MVTPDHTTSYILTTRHDGGGCVDKDTVVVKASIIDSSLRLAGSPKYWTDSGDSAVLHVQPTANIQWFKDNNLINGAYNTAYRVTETGSYYASLVNEDGCSISTKNQDILIEDPIPGINYPLLYAVIELPLDLDARHFADSVLWRPGTFLNTQTSYTPIFNGTSEQLYFIQIKTNAGCVTVDTQLVKTIKDVEIYVPTAFSPNNDGLNDILHPILRGIKEFHYFKIFNRLGQQLFESKSAQTGWDGVFKGFPQNAQVVVWVFEGLGVDNKIYQQKGSTILLR